MEVRVLGPLEVWDGPGRVALSPKERVVVGRLVLGGRLGVSDDALIAALWPDAGPATAGKTLVGYVHRVRRAMGAGAVVRLGSRYVIGGGVTTDVVVMEELAAVARRAAMDGRAEDARRAFDDAAAAFRGEPYVELDDVDEARQERVRLRELRNCLAEERLELLLQMGDEGELVGELEAFVVAEPLRERLWELLMTAYVRGGRRSEALGAFSRARRALVEELGIQPGPRLRALQREVLEGGEDQIVERRSESRADVPVVAPTGRLVGRDDDRAAVLRAIAEHRIVTLVGVGGVGKTALVHDAVVGLADVRLVELAPVEAGGVGAALLAGLGVDERPGQTPLSVAVRSCAGRDVVVVLDNCEHVLDEAALCARALTTSGPGVRVLCTSRERLRVPGERVIDVAPLPVHVADGDAGWSAATELFLLRAEEASAPVSMADAGQRAAVEDVCRRLDGLPLALELAAAQLRAQGVVELVDHLDEMPVRPRGVAVRQQSLEAVIAWSERLLDESDRAVLRRLAIFPDDFDVAAVAAVAVWGPAVTASAASALAVLVEASLVVAQPVPGAGHRYRLLETIRRFAQRRLDESGERDETLCAMVRWAVDVVDEVRVSIRTPRQDRALTRVAQERLALGVAFRHAAATGDQLAALHIASTAPVALIDERRQMIAELLAGVETAPVALVAHAWCTLANLASDQGDDAGTVDAARRGLEAAAAAGDPLQVAWARYFLVFGRWASGDLDGLTEEVAGLIATFNGLGSAHGVASMEWIASLLAGDDEAMGLANRAVMDFRALDLPSGLAHALEGRALVSMRTGELSAAAVDLAESVELVARSGNAGCTSHNLETIAAHAAEMGRMDDANELVAWAAALRAATGHGYRVWEREGHRRVMAALGSRYRPETFELSEPFDLESLARFAQEVLAGGDPEHPAT